MGEGNRSGPEGRKSNAGKRTWTAPRLTRLNFSETLTGIGFAADETLYTTGSKSGP